MKLSKASSEPTPEGMSLQTFGAHQQVPKGSILLAISRKLKERFNGEVRVMMEEDAFTYHYLVPLKK